MSYDSITNRGDYLSPHYLAEVLPRDLKKQGSLRTRWADREKAAQPTPVRGLRGLRREYFDARLSLKERADTDQLRNKEMTELNGALLRALGFPAEPRDLAVERAGEEFQVPVAYAGQNVLAIDCDWAADTDAAFDADGPGKLLRPVEVGNREKIETGAKLARWLFAADEPPRYVLLLHGGVIVLADRLTWGEGRYLAVSLDAALERADAAELELIAALFSADALQPPAEGGEEPLAGFVAGSRQHAVGVSAELREGLRESVQIIANEILDRLREQGVQPGDIDDGTLARNLGRQSLRFLYRILFLLYAEARPELGILPVDDEDYVAGYSMARLGDLVARRLGGEEARKSFHLHESLAVLFRMVNDGYRARGGASADGLSEGEGLRFEALKADLFEPARTRLIGSVVRPGYDEDDLDAPCYDTRLRDGALYRVLRRLMLSKGGGAGRGGRWGRTERGGFISYAQLGISQLGAVYEGLMSYTGFIADEELYEVAKNGDPSGGSWMIPASKVPNYADDVFVTVKDEDGFQTGERVRYRPGAFVYRLAGRDRQTSASYYTPQSLTSVTVQLALEQRVKEQGGTATAAEVLRWRVCEPALGSGAFLNEAVDQLAALYLRLREEETGDRLEPEERALALQRVKAYIALHNCYGVDLNETAVELAEVSIWLNVMHRGLQAPWFGLHLVRGNSLIGAGRRLYPAHALTKGDWLDTAPIDHPFSAGQAPSGHVHHFLLPAAGWGAVAGEKEAKQLAPDQAKQLGTWRRQLRKAPSEKKSRGHKLTQLQRLQALSARAEYLWSLVIERLRISEREISRPIDVWRAEGLPKAVEAIPREKIISDLTTPGTPYWRLKTVMDAWCALWFWPVGKAGLLDGSDAVYKTTPQPITPAPEPTPVDRDPAFPTSWEMDSLFGDTPKQLTLAEAAPDKPRPKPAPVDHRPVSLADLDDWLDFAEALLGRQDVAPDSLASHFTSLTEMEEYEDNLESDFYMHMDPVHRLGERFPWLDTVERIATDQGFFHWELRFASVFADGGFDVQLGNPPWVRPIWEENSVLAEFDPWFELAQNPSAPMHNARKVELLDMSNARNFYVGELTDQTGEETFIGSPATYDLLVGTQPDLYRAFMIRTWRNIGNSGAIGLVHPNTHFSGAREGLLREAANKRLRVHGDFVNAMLRFFADVSHVTHFGVHIYGKPQEIRFAHLSWLVDAAELPKSLELAERGELPAGWDRESGAPGVRYKGDWDSRPHPARVIRVDRNVLSLWQRLTGEDMVPVGQARLLSPVSTAEQDAIRALGDYPVRLGKFDPQISSGFHETNSKKEGIIRYDPSHPGDWSEVILKGIQIGLANPIFKSPTANSNDTFGLDLVTMSTEASPETEYRRAVDLLQYQTAQDKWLDRRSGVARNYTEFYRLAWRRQIAPNTERSLHAAMIPPGPAHVHLIHSMALDENRSTVMASGFWSSLPLDYFVRITGKNDLTTGGAKTLPYGTLDHPLAHALLLRTMRLNCLTNAYTNLWADVYDDAWRADTWACSWDSLPSLSEVGAAWNHDMPLRTERARRAALVEIDALIAVWLGMDVDALIAIYRAAFPVLNRYEDITWFDANGWKLAGYHRTYGQIQQKTSYDEFLAYNENPVKNPPPEGYTAPFYKADRVGEYRQAHAAFTERMKGRVVRPTLAAEELKRNLTQYLTTTFALADRPAREGLERFLNDPRQGMFRGPYLRIRTPFTHAGADWQQILEWAPDHPVPYQHQIQAWSRLNSKDRDPEPTLITTGTGSGKTEAFLVPILDHCRRERAAAKPGVKAVLLYPMNALATDQADRINKLLTTSDLPGVTAGLYIGERPDTTYARVLTERSDIRRDPPDIMITNYKMLDLLLQRGDDLPLWRDADIRYVVVDEFHTYDGAQGTDVAMLLRRLAAATGHAEPGRPLGRICPVATSATLGETAGSTEAIRDVAEQVFGTSFPGDSVIGEHRQAPGDFLGPVDYGLPLPDPKDLAAIPDPRLDPSAIERVAELVSGQACRTPEELGRMLRRHILTHALIEVLGDKPSTSDEILEDLPRKGPYSWGAVLRQSPQAVTAALARFAALLSMARAQDGRPFLHVETHLWIRPLSRIVRLISDRPAFGWYGEAAPEAESTLGGTPRESLPAIYCRHCGRSGWAAISPEKEPQALVSDPQKIYRAAVSDKRLVRAFVAATAGEADACAAGQRGAPVVLVLEPDGRRVRPLNPARDTGTDEAGERRRPDGVFVLGGLRHDREGSRAAERDRCPACDMDEGTRFLGAGLASLASVAITELFTGGQLPDPKKTLLFNDSVQDAAHRAGFVASRSYSFSLRTLLAAVLDNHPGRQASLNDLIADVIANASNPQWLPAVVPPDLQGRAEVDALLAGESQGDADTWRLISQRLAFQVVLEFGLRSRQGRTLELTRTAAAEVVLDDPARIAAIARDLMLAGPDTGLTRLPPPEDFTVLIRGILERLRVSGGVRHYWLNAWIGRVGTRRWGTIWGNRPDGMPAFPLSGRTRRGVSAPAFLLGQRKERTEFDVINTRQGWYADWTARCLGIAPDAAAAYLPRLLTLLGDEGIVSVRVADDGVTRVYGLQPGHIRVRCLDDGEVQAATLGCDTCHWEQVVPPEHSGDWRGRPCPRYRCTGRLAVQQDGRDHHDDYYRDLYTRALPYKVVTAEHIGAMSRAQREQVERAFRDGHRYNDPNVLSCTPTLELGIDIGDLSAVILASVPKRPASYVQRVGRAGRRTGNAFLVTFAGRRAREQYYFAEPRQMIAGEIVPPGCYLSAIEILRRQYVAHLADLAARGRLPAVLPMPRRASALFGESGWLRRLIAAATGDTDGAGRLAGGFLDLFPRHVDDAAREELRDFAERGLKAKGDEAEGTWNRHLEDLRDRLAAIDKAMSELIESDPVQRGYQRELAGERRGVARRIGEIGRSDAHGALVDLGLLPNYSLIDTSTTLEATLTWQEEQEDGGRQYHSELREYRRPARQALTELAPGNHFYIRGYRHDPSGLDVGTKDRPAWEHWRVCQQCGFVREGLDAQDTRPCPRCENPRIGDASALHKVLRPVRVTSQDRRDDARIADDDDDRQRTYYEQAIAVDVHPRDIEAGSWRHANATFGVDYTRHAIVRHFNLGVARADRPANDFFAGEETRISPFYACLSCGGTAIEQPQGHGNSDPLVSSGFDTSPSHHRPWCPQRRSVGEHADLILAHKLDTEALRILVPVATALIEERMASFAAALMAGVAAKYGGHPDHLDVVAATMPDQETGRRRRFLVLHDTLPRGTGYLQRLADQSQFRDVLESARRIVADCPCQDEGKQACHRCLLGHISDDKFALVSRAEALRMLDELLGDWATATVPDTGHISLWDQVESELEARFAKALEDWAAGSAGSVLYRRGAVLNGYRTADLHISRPDGRLVHWQVTLQNTIDGTRPDVLFRRVDAAPLTVAVYLDGYTYHAAPDKNRLAADADQRIRLRAEGTVVFQLNWDDVNAAAGETGGEHQPWHPYQGNAEAAARGTYTQLGGDPAELPGLIWTSPVRTLFGFLSDPDRAAWSRCAQAAVAGLLRQPGAEALRGDQTGVPEWIRAALTGQPLPSGGNGPVTLVRTADANGCPVTVIIDARRRDPETAPLGTWSAVVVIDDRRATIVADEQAHERRWAAWLYWGNLIQFLDEGGGDGVPLTWTGLDGFDPSALAAAGGAGLVASLMLAGQEISDAELSLLGAVRSAPSSGIAVDPQWAGVYDLLAPEVETLMHALAERKVSAPQPDQIGYELGDQAWQAELAWPVAQIAVIAPGPEAGDCIAAYVAAGWDARLPGDWPPDELGPRIPGGD